MFYILTYGVLSDLTCKLIFIKLLIPQMILQQNTLIYKDKNFRYEIWHNIFCLLQKDNFIFSQCFNILKEQNLMLFVDLKFKNQNRDTIHICTLC